MQTVPQEVISLLKITDIAWLGGRQNWHWTVYRGDVALVLRRWAQSESEVLYEIRLLERLKALGWPVATVLEEPIFWGGSYWSLSELLPGTPWERADPGELQRRGRLLAEFHADTATLTEIGQRGGWRLGEEILKDPTLDTLFAAQEKHMPEEMAMVRWHLERARQRLSEIGSLTRPTLIVHGDFTQWNLLFRDNKLSGLLDLELAHRDHRIADFALSWRGKYDAVVHSYHEVASLDPVEWALITPLWWASLIEQAATLLRAQIWDDGWIAAKLTQRSPLMGPDSAAYVSPV
ncbi:MAG: phosphotransferase [Armatimonas sp.]